MMSVCVAGHLTSLWPGDDRRHSRVVEDRRSPRGVRRRYFDSAERSPAVRRPGQRRLGSRSVSTPPNVGPPMS